MAAPLYTTQSGLLFHAGQVLIATSGLPARGKTHLAHALERYLLWLGVKAKVFSLGDYRRQKLGKPNDLPPDYFLPSSERKASTEELRNKLRSDFDDEVRAYFQAGNQVAIYDANNGQEHVRAELRSKFASLGVSVMFLETICDDPAVIEHNVRAVKLTSPDYKRWSKSAAVTDFYKRMHTREAEYETIENPSVSYVKIINVGERVVVNNIRGYLQSRVCFFLMNVHNRDRTIYLARAGEALVEHLYKADADLSSLGWQYAEELTEFMDKLRRERPDRSAASSPTVPTAPAGSSGIGGGLGGIGGGFTGLKDDKPSPNKSMLGSSGASPPAADKSDDAIGARPGLPSRSSSAIGSDAGSSRLEVWTSNRRRAAHTCTFFPDLGDKVVEKSQLRELNPGMVDGMTEAEIKERYPSEYARYQKDPYGGRYPRSESYHDLCIRIEPVIMELERASSDILIVAQSSVLRVLLGYLRGASPHEIAHIDVPEGEVIEITPQAYGMQTKAHKFWDPVQRRRARDQAWVREQRAVSASRAHSRAPSRSSPNFGPARSGSRSARSSNGTLPSPHLGAILAPLTRAKSFGASPRPSFSHGNVPGHAIPPLYLPQTDSSAVCLEEDEDLELSRQQRELERVAALDQLADELGHSDLKEGAEGTPKQRTVSSS